MQFGTTLGRRVLGASAVTATAAAALLALAAPASAHIPNWNAKCENGETTVSVDLSAYDSRATNAVTVKDGDDVILENKDFGGSYKDSKKVSGAVDHTFTLIIKAGDDPDGSKHFSITDTKTVKKCVEQTTTTVPTTTTQTETTTETTTQTSPETTTSEESSTTSTTTESSTSATTTTTNAVAVPASNNTDGLASTGASIAVPLVIGLGLLAAGGAALVVVRRRRTAE
jgi:LPXTG-motif cell wall-anchored protein